MASVSDAASTARRDRLIGGFAALAIAIHVVEAALPSPLPGAKPGLANVITLIVLMRYDWWMAAWVSALRVLVGSLLIGTFLSPTFLMSASGAVAAILAMGIANLAGRGRFSALGYSVLAALAHMTAQFLVAYSLFIPHPGLWRLFPPLLLMAVLFGVVSGMIANAVLQKLDAP